MEKIHCCVKIDLKPTDYRMGDGKINLKGMPLFPSGNSLADFLFYEPQLLSWGDTDGCVIFSGQETIDALWEVMTQLGIISAKTNAWAESLGFMDIGTDGKKHFHSSERFLQIRTGNGLNGNNLTDVFDAARKYGLVPYKDFPVDQSLTPEQYIDPASITTAMANKAIQFLAGVGGKTFLKYQWVNDGKADSQKRAAALPYGPLLIGVNVGPNWNSATPPAPVNGMNPGHCVSLFAEVLTPNDEADVFDHYLPNPKKLINWDIRYALQVFLTVTPPPPAPLPPANPTVPTTLKWYEEIAAWLAGIIESITPSGRAKLGGASRSAQWPAFKKEFAKTHPMLCALCGGTKQLNLHHLKPFHVYPELELEPTNVIWLCNEKECHIRVGHLGNFQSINPTGLQDVKLWHDKVAARPQDAEAIKEAFQKVGSPTQ